MDIAPKYTLGLLFAASGRDTVSFRKLDSLPKKNSVILITAKKNNLTLVTFAYPAVRLGMFGHKKLFLYNIIKIPFEILAF